MAWSTGISKQSCTMGRSNGALYIFSAFTFTTGSDNAPGEIHCRTLPAAPSHCTQNEEMRDLTLSRSPANPGQTSKAWKAKEIELKNWGKSQKH